MPNRLFKLHEKSCPGLAAEYLSVTGPPLNGAPQACNQRKQKAVAILAGGISLEETEARRQWDCAGCRGHHHLAVAARLWGLSSRSKGIPGRGGGEFQISDIGAKT